MRSGVRELLRHDAGLTPSHAGLRPCLVAHLVGPPDRLVLGCGAIGRRANLVPFLDQLDAALREALAEDRGRRRLLVRQNFLDLIAEAALEVRDRRAIATVFPRHRLLALAAGDD